MRIGFRFIRSGVGVCIPHADLGLGYGAQGGWLATSSPKQLYFIHISSNSIIGFGFVETLGTTGFMLENDHGKGELPSSLTGHSIDLELKTSTGVDVAATMKLSIYPGMGKAVYTVDKFRIRVSCRFISNLYINALLKKIDINNKKVYYDVTKVPNALFKSVPNLFKSDPNAFALLSSDLLLTDKYKVSGEDICNSLLH